MPKVLITEPMPLVKEEVAILEKHAKVEVSPSPDHASIKARIMDADVVLVNYAEITADVLEVASKLKGIVKYGVGLDNINVEKASELGVTVVNVPDYATDSVADHVFALLLTLTRKITVANDLMSKGLATKWTSPPDSLKGVELRGKTLGLIGLGRIGAAVAQRALSFGTRVIAFDPYLTGDRVREIGAEPKSLDEVLRTSDFISLHSPLTDETRSMINEASIAKMKDGVFIINTARGPLIDAGALSGALKTGKIAGAGLDVFSHEPPSPSDELFGLENVIRTPHIAWYTEESLRRIEMTVVQDALDVLDGRTPTHTVNKEGLQARHLMR